MGGRPSAAGTCSHDRYATNTTGRALRDPAAVVREARRMVGLERQYHCVSCGVEHRSWSRMTRLPGLRPGLRRRRDPPGRVRLVALERGAAPTPGRAADSCPALKLSTVLSMRRRGAMVIACVLAFAGAECARPRGRARALDAAAGRQLRLAGLRDVGPRRIPTGCSSSRRTGRSWRRRTACRARSSTSTTSRTPPSTSSRPAGSAACSRWPSRPTTRPRACSTSSTTAAPAPTRRSRATSRSTSSGPGTARSRWRASGTS